MNSLSWLIYLSGVLPALGTVLVVGSLVFLGVSLLVGMFCFIESHNRVEPDEYKKDMSDKAKYCFLKIPLLCSIPLLIGLAIPTKQTMYLIVGSEAGEYVMETEEAREIYKDIRSVIQSYTKEEKH